MPVRLNLCVMSSFTRSFARDCFKKQQNLVEDRTTVVTTVFDPTQAATDTAVADGRYQISENNTKLTDWVSDMRACMYPLASQVRIEYRSAFFSRSLRLLFVLEYEGNAHLLIKRSPGAARMLTFRCRCSASIV